MSKRARTDDNRIARSSRKGKHARVDPWVRFEQAQLKDRCFIAALFPELRALIWATLPLRERARLGMTCRGLQRELRDSPLGKELRSIVRVDGDISVKHGTWPLFEAWRVCRAIVPTGERIKVRVPWMMKKDTPVLHVHYGGPMSERAPRPGCYPFASHFSIFNRSRGRSGDIRVIIDGFERFTCLQVRDGLADLVSLFREWLQRQMAARGRVL